jgi:hypothetical protein
MFISLNQENISAYLAHGVARKIEKKAFNFPLSFICYNNIVWCWDMNHWSHCLNSWQCQENNKKNWIQLKLDHGRIHAPSDDEGNKLVVQATHYIAFNYDKIFIFDNQLWLFIQHYVVENYIRIPIFIYLDWMVTRLKSDTLTKVIMEMLIIGSGLP